MILSSHACRIRFQSTLPRRERLNCVRLDRRSRGFNPRSHAGSDVRYVHSLGHKCCVSIHAPTQGATSWIFHLGSLLSQFQSTLPRRERQYSSITLTASSAVSIHAPTQGATSAFASLIVSSVFQSTLPRRERLNQIMNLFMNRFVSIHAPTQGATVLPLD